ELLSMDELSEKKIAVVKNDIYYQAFKTQAEKFYISPQFIEVNGFAEVLQRLDSKQVDAGLVSRLFGSYHKHEYQVQETLFSIHPVEIHLAVQKGLNQDVIEAANQNIALLKKDKHSVLYRSKSIWLEGVYKLVFPKWLRPEWALIFLFGFISAILAGMAILRRLLKIRTRELHATISAKEKIESELRIAHEIQMESVPRIFPPFPERKELDIFAVLEPAREVGGDFYDFFFIDENRLCFVIADVSGKGVPAALFMSAVKTLIKATAKHVHQPGKLLESVNLELAPENESCTFVTVFCGLLNLSTGEVRYTNAGHNSPLLLRQEHQADFIPSTRTTVVGVDEEAVYHEATLTLVPGETLCLYTDGITEAFDAEDAMFTEERLQQTLGNYPADSMQHFVPALLKDVKNFAGETPQSDDMTVL
ncbi:MAG: SpoIIE family protein phosphatase, partial [bacterium]|nr:SpoIIE family protein phosphatase [bacterium]